MCGKKCGFPWFLDKAADIFAIWEAEHRGIDPMLYCTPKNRSILPLPKTIYIYLLHIFTIIPKNYISPHFITFSLTCSWLNPCKSQCFCHFSHDCSHGFHGFNVSTLANKGGVPVAVSRRSRQRRPTWRSERKKFERKKRKPSRRDKWCYYYYGD